MKKLVFSVLLATLLLIVPALAEELRLPENITVIKRETFFNLQAAENVVLPDGVVRIENYAFANSKIMRINLPASIRYIAGDAFEGCKNLVAKVKDGSYAMEYCEEHGIAYENYDFADETADYKYTVADGEASIIQYLGSAAYVTVPSQIDGYPVVSVAFTPEPVSDAFARTYNTTLKRVTLPETVREIGKWGFNYCSALEDITIPGHIETIGRSAFFMSIFPSLTISSGVKTIGDNAFRGAAGFTSLTIPASVETIGDSAFQGCDDLTYAVINSGVKTIGSCAFEYCEALKEVTIPSSVTGMGEVVFKHCKALEKAVINAQITKLEMETFYSCSALKTVVLPNGLTQLGPGAFLGCDSLEAVELPNTLKSIGEAAFRECALLNSAILPEGLQSIHSEAFYDCDSLKTLKIPQSVTFIGTDAFKGGYVTAILHVVENSYAHTWCKNNSWPFKLV